MKFIFWSRLKRNPSYTLTVFFCYCHNELSFSKLVKFLRQEHAFVLTIYQYLYYILTLLYLIDTRICPKPICTLCAWFMSPRHYNARYVIMKLSQFFNSLVDIVISSDTSRNLITKYQIPCRDGAVRRSCYRKDHQRGPRT